MKKAVSKRYIIVMSSLKNDLKPIFLPVFAFASLEHTPQQFFHSKSSVFKNSSTCLSLQFGLLKDDKITILPRRFLYKRT